MTRAVARSLTTFASVALLTGFSATGAFACTDFSAAPSTRWSLNVENGVSWLVTPCGEHFFSLGVNVLDGGNLEREKVGTTYSGYSWEAFAPTLSDWAAETRQRLFSWGFNSAGGWALPPQVLKLPTVINLELGRLARFHWFDPFAPETETRMNALAQELVAPYRDTPYRIGYFSDNEVGWWAGALFIFYSSKPAGSVTKQRWVELLRRHYSGDWSRFTADFLPPEDVGSWDQLLDTTQSTHMKPGGAGIRAVREWTGMVAEHYYALAERAIRAADPEALFFGDRLPIYYDPAAVRAMTPHVDAIAVNYNVDSSDGWIADYFFDGLRKLSGGKPTLVSEWFFAARENRSGNRNNGHLMTVATQEERAAGAAAAITNFAAIPEIVGAHWFQYYDHPRGGRTDGEDYDFGLVDISDRPYRHLISALGAANRRTSQIHAAAAVPPLRTGIFVLPHAAVSVHDHSLSDWPKPSSLLPRLKPSPGSVEFGEAYLTWGEQGLALATIGQDYFDIDLLAYNGGFPLVDAYRVELGVDFGAGPRRFTLFFIPPRTKLHDHPPMSAQLCAGAAQSAMARGCTGVSGAEAVYFGADQPRITAELMIPWSALGITAPTPGTQLRAEIAITSWDRERWMSLSGRAPDVAMNHPEDWPAMRLGNGRQMIESVPPWPAPAPG
ncbi:MAG: hypothetical protein JO282_06620 [Alphaproteobacteria bacterium]|nr:hypothetical protein [Alphaproteobacteria bacterium]